jgi:hypothetical protein
MSKSGLRRGHNGCIYLTRKEWALLDGIASGRGICRSKAVSFLINSYIEKNNSFSD